MKLNFAQIKDITLGAVRVEEVDNEIHFYRFTKRQEELYKKRSAALERCKGFDLKSFSTSGVQLRFRTNSERVFLSVVTALGCTRTYFSFEVFVNGVRIDALKNFSEAELVGNYTKNPFPLGDFSKEFSLGTGEKEVCIYFPWSVKVTLKELSIDNNSFIEPVKPSKKLLCFGDSITHGYDVLYPSNKYATKLAKILDAEEYNKAIGGETYFPELAAAREDFDPDYITIAYGSNDWNKCTREELTQNCKAFLTNVRNNYPNAKVFVITPIWRKDMHKSSPFGDFLEVGKVIEEQAAGIGNISVIRGFEFVPQEESLFADLRLHPNDKGYEYYIDTLWSHIKEILRK